MLLGVDVGGTFTDAALLTREGLRTAKSPTTPEDQSEGVMAAIDAVLEGDAPGGVERFVHGMTVGTNALLEGKVARTALLATEGFTDVEELGRQARASLYRLCVGHPPPIVPPRRRIAVPERCGPEGETEPLDEAVLRRRLEKGLDDAEAVAVCLLWGFRHPEHERRVGALVPDGVHVSLAHDTAAVFREYERCATTVVDAALSPLLSSYLGRLAGRSRDAGLPEPEVMLSGGGVAPAASAAEHGSWTVLSGPAGGAVGAALLAAAADAPQAVCLDMGGTSCDVSVAEDGAAAKTGHSEIGGRPLALPMVDVHTVGAGGGSIAWRDPGGALRVGPRSAGASPGPACYGRGGEEPTVTDADLVLGRLGAGASLAGGVTLDAGAAERAVDGLARELGMDPLDAAAGIARVADSEMAQAVRVMTVERGRDPREMALLAFGGAGPLHACAIAEELDMGTVVVPPTSGVLSALGLVLSERRRDLAESVLLAGERLTRQAAAKVVERLAQRGREELGSPGATVRASYDLRYGGQAWELTVTGEPEPDPKALRAAFEAAHEERYGYADPGAELELVTVRVAVAEEGRGAPAHPVEDREPLVGPVSHPLPDSTVWVPEGWRGEWREDGTLVLGR